MNGPGATSVRPTEASAPAAADALWTFALFGSVGDLVMSQG